MSYKLLPFPVLKLDPLQQAQLNSAVRRLEIALSDLKLLGLGSYSMRLGALVRELQQDVERSQKHTGRE